MSARIDAATLLERALIANAGSIGLALRIASASATRWASATFVGARHRLAVEGAWSTAAGAWLDGLAEADLPIRRHLVADLAVVEHAHDGDHFTATLEVLTVEEA